MTPYKQAWKQVASLFFRLVFFLGGKTLTPGPAVPATVPAWPDAASAWDVNHAPVSSRFCSLCRIW